MAVPDVRLLRRCPRRFDGCCGVCGRAVHHSTGLQRHLRLFFFHGALPQDQEHLRADERRTRSTALADCLLKTVPRDPGTPLLHNTTATAGFGRLSGRADLLGLTSAVFFLFKILLAPGTSRSVAQLEIYLVFVFLNLPVWKSIV